MTGTSSLNEVDNLCNTIASARGNPLLVMYYPDPNGRVMHFDVKDIYDEFRRRGWNKERTIENLDAILHTYGGDPNACYRVAQVIRDFSRKVTFLIPFHATSGGTLMCFCSNKIVLGAYAVLGPIDITLDGIELASVDYYMNFVEECRETIERMLHKLIKEMEIGSAVRVTTKPCTNVESDLLVEMVRQAGALNVGKFFRERTVTGHYAYRLLYDYMFADKPNRDSLAQSITDEVLFEYPSHDFDMDYHICKELGLPVEEMNDTESDQTKLLVHHLDNLTEQGVICKDIADNYKAPFFRLYNGGVDGESNE